MDDLRRLAASWATQALWLAARRAGLDVTKKQVTTFVRKRGEKQVFQPLQPARGKTVAAGAETTYQMDLVDMRNSPGVQDSTTFTSLLVLVNVFDRTTYTRALRTKGQGEVRTALSSLLASLPAAKVIASDGGAEFTGPVSDT